jgi:hypothetical protein
MAGYLLVDNKMMDSGPKCGLNDNGVGVNGDGVGVNGVDVGVNGDSVGVNGGSVGVNGDGGGVHGDGDLSGSTVRFNGKQVSLRSDFNGKPDQSKVNGDFVDVRRCAVRDNDGIVQGGSDGVTVSGEGVSAVGESVNGDGVGANGKLDCSEGEDTFSDSSEDGDSGVKNVSDSCDSGVYCEDGDTHVRSISEDGDIVVKCASGNGDNGADGVVGDGDIKTAGKTSECQHNLGAGLSETRSPIKVAPTTPVVSTTPEEVTLSDIMKVSKDARWFVGVMSRTDSEDMLTMGGYKPGTYMVRESETQAGKFALTVLTQPSMVRHFRICHNDQGVYVHASNVFESIENLIVHYSEISHSLGIYLQFAFKAGNEPERKSSQFDVSSVLQNMGQEWTIQWDSLLLKRCLGDGHFSQVWEAVWRGSTRVAVKMLKPGLTNQMHFVREAAVMKKLNHPKLLQFYGVSLHPRNGGEKLPVLVTEYLSGGSLLDLLRSDEGQKLSLSQLREIACEVCEGMRYMERHNYIHRDLAARNILVDCDMQIKLGDFGLVLLNDGTDPVDEENLPFATKWLSPEVLTCGQFSTKSDVWAFGILLMELVMFGDSPYPGLSNREVATKVKNGYQMIQPINCPDKLYQVACQCWEAKPEKRPKFSELDTVLRSTLFKHHF